MFQEKRYNLQKDMKIYINCEKKVIENEIEIIFSCDKYDNIPMKPSNVDEINFQTENETE